MVEYFKDHFTCEVLDGHETYERYTVMDGVIYYQNRIFLAIDTKLKKKILHVAHEALLFGHTDFMGAYSHGRVSRGICSGISGNVQFS